MSPIDTMNDDELQALKDRVAELEALFDLQYRRAEQATKDWQAATGKTDTWPDYGDMLVWLMGERDDLLARLASAERVLKAYEQWEADVLLDNAVWREEDGLPHLTQPRYDRLVEIQAMCNAALASKGEVARGE